MITIWYKAEIRGKATELEDLVPGHLLTSEIQSPSEVEEMSSKIRAEAGG